MSRINRRTVSLSSTIDGRNKINKQEGNKKTRPIKKPNPDIMPSFVRFRKRKERREVCEWGEKYRLGEEVGWSQWKRRLTADCHQTVSRTN